MDKKIREARIDAQVSIVLITWSVNVYSGTLGTGGHYYVQLNFNGASFLLEPQTGQIEPKPKEPKDVIKHFNTPDYTPLDPVGGSTTWSSDPKWGGAFSSAHELYSRLSGVEPHPATRPKEVTDSTYNGMIERGLPKLAEVFKELDEYLTDMRYKEPAENRFKNPNDRLRH